MLSFLPNACPKILVAIGLLGATGFVHRACGEGRVLRVMADPNNLPYSNAQEEGFENKIVNLVAQELGAKVEYIWEPQQGGTLRNSLNAVGCDFAAGVPAGAGAVLTTNPYYQTHYVFLSRTDRGLQISSLNDQTLHQLKLGIPLGPAGDALADAVSASGLAEGLHRYMVFSDCDQGPTNELVDALARGEIDVAIVSSALGDYYQRTYAGVLAVTPGEDDSFGPSCANQLCLGVNRSSPELREELNNVLLRKRPEIQSILANFRAPGAEGG